MKAIVGPHIIGGAEPHRTVLAEWQPRLAVLLDPEAKDVAALPAGTISIGRIYVPESEMDPRIRANPEEAAQFAHDRIRSSSAFGHVNFFVVENEILQQWDGLPFLNRYMVRRMELANTAGYKCGIGATSVGNLDMPENDRLALYRQVFPALAMAEAGGHAWLCHQYGWPDLWGPADKGGSDWMVHRLEHQLIPLLKPTFPRLKYAVTEIGVDKLIVNQVGGWQESGKTAEQYALDLYHIGQYLEKFSTDVLGYAVFTLGHNDPWQTYDIQGEVASRLAALYREERAKEEHQVFIPVVTGPQAEPEPEPKPEPHPTDLAAKLARVLGIRPAQMRAILKVESGGRAFAADGRMIVRFEVHIFRRYRPNDWNKYFVVDGPKLWQGHRYQNTAGNLTDVHASQADEWAALSLAISIDREAALKSLAMGAPQIMGFNHRTVGYTTVEEMYQSYQASATNQLVGLALFIVEHDLVDALRREDYLTFATVYNGSGQAELYAKLIAKAAQEETTT